MFEVHQPHRFKQDFRVIDRQGENEENESAKA
jgi:hypothetical protein